MTGAQYREMVKQFVSPALQETLELWWQQDGATGHSTRETLQLLRDMLGERLIGRSTKFNWPASSHNLSAPGVFLWVYLKNNVYINIPNNNQQ